MKITERGKGFIYNNQRIYFLEPKGQDISFERWRITAYYEPNFALTLFFDTEVEYNKFIGKKSRFCYADYDDFKLKIKEARKCQKE